MPIMSLTNDDDIFLFILFGVDAAAIGAAAVAVIVVVSGWISLITFTLENTVGVRWPMLPVDRLTDLVNTFVCSRHFRRHSFRFIFAYQSSASISLVFLATALPFYFSASRVASLRLLPRFDDCVLFAHVRFREMLSHRTDSPHANTYGSDIDNSVYRLSCIFA